MKLVLLSLMLLITTLQAGVTVDKDKFGRVQHVHYTGFVMDGEHAQRIAKKVAGIGNWVRKANTNTYTSGHRVMTYTSKSVTIVLSYEMAMSNHVRAKSTRNPSKHKRNIKFGTGLQPTNWASQRKTKSCGSKSKRSSFGTRKRG